MKRTVFTPPMQPYPAPNHTHGAPMAQPQVWPLYQPALQPNIHTVLPQAPFQQQAWPLHNAPPLAPPVVPGPVPPIVTQTRNTRPRAVSLLQKKYIQQQSPAEEPAPRGRRLTKDRQASVDDQGDNKGKRGRSMSVSARIADTFQNLSLNPFESSKVKAPKPVVEKSDGSIFIDATAHLSDVQPYLFRNNPPDANLILVGGPASHKGREGVALMWVSRSPYPTHPEYGHAYVDKTEREARDILKNLIRESELPEQQRPVYMMGSPAPQGHKPLVYVPNQEAAINSSAAYIDREPELSQPNVQRAIGKASKLMYTSGTASLPLQARQSDFPPNMPPHMTPRMPSDCLAHWLDVLDSVRSDLINKGSQHRLKRLEEWEREARRKWMSHDMEAGSVKAYFKSMVNELKGSRNKADFPVLANLVGQLHTEMERLEKSGGPTLPALQDAAMQRAWESSFAQSLVRNPLPATLDSAFQIGRHLAGRLDLLVKENPIAAQKVVDLFHKYVSEDQTFWIRNGSVPELSSFINAPAHQRVAWLRAYFLSSVTTGAKCVGIYYSTVKFSKALQNEAPNYIPWGNSAEDKQDVRVQEKARKRERRMGQMTMGSGIQHVYQRPMSVDSHANEYWFRGAGTFRPDLSDPTPAVKTALNRGTPFVGGASGSAMFITKAAHHMITQESGTMDPRQVVLGAYMFLAFDGGHSLHEVLWADNNIKDRYDMGIRGHQVERDEFVGDYQRFIDSFDSQSRKHLRKAENKAFDDMIGLRRSRLPQTTL